MPQSVEDIQRAADEIGWNRALGQNSLEGYNRYIEGEGLGEHHEEARQRKEQLILNRSIPVPDFKKLLKGKALPVPFGTTRIDLDADGRLDSVLHAWRENHNAHGFEWFAFIRTGPGGRRSVPELVTIGEYNGTHLSTYQGADCVLQGYRFFIGPDRRLRFVQAERPLGDGFAAKARVFFSNVSPSPVLT